MTALRLLIALPLAALAACVPPAPEPTPAPTPAPQPQPSQAPPQVVTPTYDNWMDAPQTPGDWTYAGGTASFSQPGTGTRFAMGCDRATRTVSLVRSGEAPVAVPMTVRTETADRQLTARPENEGMPTLAATLPAQDSFLDAIAFSKGRFAVEISGLDTLYLPAWPEISRVIDDCR